MKVAFMELGIFPLPIFILPGGKLKLRIFEPKYIRLVKESFSSNGFVLSMYNDEATFNSADVGMIVEIVNFDTLKDGLLSIDVQAKGFVKLSNMYLESDGLLKADTQPVNHWANDTKYDPLHKEDEITQFLNQAFNNSKQLNTLYSETKFEDKVWVCARILEILPITTFNKVKISTLNFEQCENFLHTVIKGK